LKRTLPTLFLLLLASVGFGQAYTIPFEPIGVDDRMDSAGLEQLERGNYDMILPDGTYKKGPEDTNVNEGLVLITKEKDMYLVHVVYFGTARDWSAGPVTRSDDGRYFLAHTSYGNFSRGHETAGMELWIIDPQNATLAKLDTYYYSFEWTFDPETEQQLDNKTSFVTQVVLQGNELTLLNTCTEESVNVTCADPGSVYVIGNGALTRSMEYDPVHLRMVPLRYAGPIATGMLLHDVEGIHPYGSMWTDAQQDYGFEPSYQNDSGSVVTDGNDRMCFVRMREGAQADRIKDIVAISPTYIIGGVHTGNSCAELIARYPKLVLRIDPFNGWEVADVEEPPMRITFKTTEKDRVGRYTIDKATGHSVFKSIARPAAQIDLITVHSP